ncbi:MAG: hemerythrin domain-containing protein [Bryobacteraceae bacterium]|nr:hemerythrin domain-containing protein [Bryobacteraceae bacterium]
MPVHIGGKPESDFGNPIGLLGDCHRRIENFLNVLHRVAHEARGAALTAARRDAFDRALTYFRTGAPRHTEDEDDSLFPRLREIDAGREALEQMERLRQDHQQAAILEARVQELGSRWLASGTLSREDAGALCDTLDRMQALYREHIELEDSRLFPLADRVLPARAKAEIGREMAERRGVAR